MSFSQVRNLSDDNSNATLRAKQNMRGVVGVSRYEVEHLYKAPIMPAMFGKEGHEGLIGKEVSPNPD